MGRPWRSPATTRCARPAVPGFSPLDEELRLLPGTLSPSIIEGAVRLGTWVPFARAAEFVRLFTGVRLGEDTVRRLTEGAGAAYEAVQTAEATRLARECPAPPAGPDVQQLSVDGAMVPLRGKGEWAEVKTLTIGTVGTEAPVAPVAPVGSAAPVAWEARATELSYFSRLADHTTFS